MWDSVKRLSSKLPRRAQQELKRIHFRRQLRSGSFQTSEPEYAKLGEWIAEGDWVIDVGANVGHYTVRLSQLVGQSGRVLAFEPVLDTFELLVSNISAAGAQNVSLFNAAVSERSSVMAMSMPRFVTGLANYYMASLTTESGDIEVLTISLDSIPLPKPVTLVKIDVEGHELPALLGMRHLLMRDRPRLIVEGVSVEVAELLKGLGYRFEELDGSPNRLFYVPV